MSGFLNRIRPFQLARSFLIQSQEQAGRFKGHQRRPISPYKEAGLKTDLPKALAGANEWYSCRELILIQTKGEYRGVRNCPSKGARQNNVHA
jgi:hypothetical protein